MNDPVLTYYDVASDVVAFSSTRRGGYGTGVMAVSTSTVGAVMTL